MAATISFNKIGYDPFIDFLKAYAIIFVIVAHNLPTSFWDYCLFRVWGDMQVPLFILIQSFHAYKKGIEPKIKWRSLLNRIVIPFIFIQGLILIFRLFFSTLSIRDVLVTSALGGGYGPGAYYFWIYLQVAIILVLIWPFVKKLTRSQLTWLFLFFSVGCEVLFSLIQLPDAVYRLLAVRYLFLIPLALLWIEDGVVLNFKNIALSVISIGAVLFFCFSNLNMEPFFYSTGWATHRWICYYYLPILLTYALWMVFKWTSKSKILSSFIKEIAKSSYEIYLIQMMVFVIIPVTSFDFIHNIFLGYSIWILVTFILGIAGGILFNRLVQRIIIVKKK